MLAWTIYISFLGVLVLMLLPLGNALNCHPALALQYGRIVALESSVPGIEKIL